MGYRKRFHTIGAYAEDHSTDTSVEIQCSSPSPAVNKKSKPPLNADATFSENFKFCLETSSSSRLSESSNEENLGFEDYERATDQLCDRISYICDSHIAQMKELISSFNANTRPSQV